MPDKILFTSEKEKKTYLVALAQNTGGREPLLRPRSN